MIFSHSDPPSFHLQTKPSPQEPTVRKKFIASPANYLSKTGENPPWGLSGRGPPRWAVHSRAVRLEWSLSPAPRGATSRSGQPIWNNFLLLLCFPRKPKASNLTDPSSLQARRRLSAVCRTQPPTFAAGGHLAPSDPHSLSPALPGELPFPEF